MITRLLVIIVSLLISLSLSAQFIVNEEPIVLKTTTGDLYGTLKVPTAKIPVYLAVIIAGSGPTDRNGNQPSMKNNSLKMLSDGLFYEGIASLSFDKRAIAESKDAGKKEEDLRFEDMVDDVKQWIDLLSGDKRFSEIIVIGHSEGSLIGMLAAKDNAKVAKYVSIAGVGEPAGNILKEQLEKQLASQPPALKDMIFSYIDKLEQGQTIEDVPMNLYSLFRPSVQPYMISWLKYNPQTEISKLTIPILILQGTTDIQVSTEQAGLLAKANSKAKSVIIENMNHVLKDCVSMEMQEQLTSTYTNPTKPINKELIDNIVSFIIRK